MREYTSCRVKGINWIAFGLCWLFFSVSSQAGFAPKFNSYSVEDGLSQVTVFDMAQSPDGFIWLATQTGIDRFDGYNFQHIGRNLADRERGLLGITSYQLEADPNGEYLWVGTLEGLSRYHYATGLFTHYLLNSLGEQRSESVRRLYFDQNQQLYIASPKSVYRFTDNPQQPLVHLISVTAGQGTINDIVVIPELGLLLATSKGLFLLSSQTNTFIQITAKPSNRVLLAENNLLWVGTIQSGVQQFVINGQNFELKSSISSEQGLADSMVNDLLIQSNGMLWVATTGGISIVDTQNLYNVVTPDVDNSGLADEFIMALFESTSGLVWLGSMSDGFSIFDPESIKFNTYLVNDSYDVSNVAVADEELLWVTSQNGLWKWNLTTRQAQGPWPLFEGDATGKAPNRITAVVYNQQADTVWVATRTGLGRYFAEDELVKIVAFQDTSIYSLAIDKDGDIWLGGTTEGVYVYRPSTDSVIRHWPLPLTPKLLVDEGKVWASTINGLALLDKQTGAITQMPVRTEQNPVGLTHNVITWISKSHTAANTYWVATQGGGINVMEVDIAKPEQARFREIAANTRLSRLSVGAIFEDSANTLWLSTTEGISAISLTDEKVKYYDSRNGSSDSGYYIGSGVQLSDNTIIFGGKEGLTEFDPGLIVDSQWQPEVVLLSMTQLTEQALQPHTTDNIMQTWNEQALTILPDVLSFTFEFSALDYASPKNLQYAYMLEGFDKTWRFTDATRRTATYTNLDPGQYQLQVKATNKDGVWSNKLASIEIVVKAPWWQTSWAMGLFVTLIAASLFILYRLRVNALRAQSAMLAKLVEEKTQDLESAVQKLTLLSHQDPLTGVSNRRDFTRKAQLELERFQRNADPFSMLLIDVDHFKEFNDRYGHDAGDEVLKTIANCLQNNARKYDTVARWGGEEFIVLLPSLELDAAEIVANKLRVIVSQCGVEYGEQTLTVECTIGLAQIKQNESIAQCLKRADHALYVGKSEGRNCVRIAD